MPFVAIVTLIGVALTVLALAGYLTRIALLLKHVNFTLGTILAALWSISNQTQGMRSTMGEITSDLSQAQSALDRVLTRERERTPAPQARPQTGRRPRRSRAGSRG
ncbi:MAG: hypothetical protein M3276_09425 [Actinomycetota bacterium]|nr:hypothetical protein [Actinomycetota bacterium]